MLKTVLLFFCLVAKGVAVHRKVLILVIMKLYHLSTDSSQQMHKKGQNDINDWGTIYIINGIQSV